MKNFPQKMEALTKELKVIKVANKDLQEQLNETAQVKKQLRAQEFKLEERQREVLNRQRLLKQPAGSRASHLQELNSQ